MFLPGFGDNRRSAFRAVLPYLLLFFAACAGTSPLLRWGFWPFGYDAECHCKWFYHFSRQFWSGDIYPRWLTGMNGGLGSPVFYYYPPLPYWITSLIKALLPSDQYGWYSLAISVTLALFLSGVAAYHYFRELVTLPAATIGAIAYQLFPYHLSIDLYMRAGAFAEFWAFVWLPWLILFAHRILLVLLQNCQQSIGTGIRGINWRLLCVPIMGFAVTFAALAMTHLPTVMTFFWVPITYCCLSSIWLRTPPASSAGVAKALCRVAWHPGLVLMLAMALGTGVASPYVLPALLTQSSVSMAEMIKGNLYYKDHFLAIDPLKSNPWLAKLYLLVGSSILGGALAACGSWLCLRVQQHTRAIAGEPGIYRPYYLFTVAKVWCACLAGSMIMLLPISNPFYLLFPMLQMIQFPWRFSVGIAVCVASLFAIGIHLLAGMRKGGSGTNLPKWVPSILYVLFLFLAYWILITVDAGTTFWTNHLSRPSAMDPSYADVIEYRPRWAFENWDATVGRLGVESNSNVSAAMVGGTVLNISGASDSLAFRIKTLLPGTLRIHQFYYPGWVAKSGTTAFEGRPSLPDGLVEFSIPSGDYDLTVKREMGVWERIGTVCSVSCTLFIVAVLLSRLRFRPKTGGIEP